MNDNTEVDTFDDMLSWFNGLSEERRKKVMYEVEANIIAGSPYKRKTMKVYFKDEEAGLKIVGIENK